MPGDSAAERAFYFLRFRPAAPDLSGKSARHGKFPTGGCLLVPNHITWVDAIILQLACPRPVRFIIDRGILSQADIQPVLRIGARHPDRPA